MNDKICSLVSEIEKLAIQLEITDTSDWPFKPTLSDAEYEKELWELRNSLANRAKMFESDPTYILNNKALELLHASRNLLSNVPYETKIQNSCFSGKSPDTLIASIDLIFSKKRRSEALLDFFLSVPHIHDKLSPFLTHHTKTFSDAFEALKPHQQKALPILCDFFAEEHFKDHLNLQTSCETSWVRAYAETTMAKNRAKTAVQLLKKQQPVNN